LTTWKPSQSLSAFLISAEYAGIYDIMSVKLANKNGLDEGEELTPPA